MTVVTGNKPVEDSKHTCVTCGKVCKTEFALKGHMRTHEKEKIEKDLPPEPSKEEKIEITKSQFEKLLEQMEDLKKKGEFLESVADKKAVAQYYARHKKELPVYVKLRTWKYEKDGEEVEEVIVGWRTVRDLGSYIDTNTGRWVEKQDVEIVLEGGRKIEMPLMLWNQRYAHVECEMTGEETDEKGNVSLKLKRLDTGKEYVVGVQFVN